MKRIQIPSVWATGEGVADFKLGLGPCGKVVQTLTGHWDNGLYVVQQITECGERKIFRYPVHTITGRIVETF